MFRFEALQGARVLDLTRLLPGPLATYWMAGMGAEVIKIEDPCGGDYLRSMDMGSLFETINGSKKSVALDLKTSPGRDALHRLARTADVLLEGFRPGVMDRLGCGWNTLASVNPRLIYVALSGYGADTPYSNLAGHDINYLAMAGVLDAMGSAGAPPTIPGVQIADIAGGSMQALIGVLAALLERERTGAGRFVDVSMTRGSAALLPVLQAKDPQVLRGHYACYNVYRARDGRFVAVGALEHKFWTALCHALGLDHFIPDQFAPDPRRTEMIDTLAHTFARRDAEDWFAHLRNTDACVTPVRTATESGFAFEALGDAPQLGQHTLEFLPPPKQR